MALNFNTISWGLVENFNINSEDGATFSNIDNKH